jgi:hypothetical protein
MDWCCFCVFFVIFEKIIFEKIILFHGDGVRCFINKKIDGLISPSFISLNMSLTQ